jgi:hypothetical protein
MTGRTQKAAMPIIPRKILRPRVAGKYYLKGGDL